jgi:hypothetical protein
MITNKQKEGGNKQRTMVGVRIDGLLLLLLFNLVYRPSAMMAMQTKTETKTKTKTNI